MMAERYERLAADGDGDIWTWRGGRWACVGGGQADDDAELEAQFPPVTFYVPAPPRYTVTFDLTDPDALHVLTTALGDYAAHERPMAEGEDASESRTRWAELADRMRAQAEAAG